MTHVQVARGVGKHVQHVHLRAAGDPRPRGAVEVQRVPDVEPPLLARLRVVGVSPLGRRCSGCWSRSRLSRLVLAANTKKPPAYGGSPRWPDGVSAARASKSGSHARSVYAAAPLRRGCADYSDAGAARHLERELSQSPPIPADRLARSRQARHRLPAGDQARRRRLRRPVRRRPLPPRLPLRPRRAGPLERRRDPVASRARRRHGGPRRRRPVRSATEARAVGATCGGIRVWSVYVPNGRTIDDPMYEAKLTWLGAPRRRGGCGRAEGAVRRRRRLQHRPDRCRRLGSRGLRRRHPRDRSGARRPGPAERAGSGRSGTPAVARRRAGLQLLGLPRRGLPPGPRHADRPAARARPTWPAG